MSRKTLSAIDAALAEIATQDQRQPGEFTAREFHGRAVEGGSSMTFSACRQRLMALADNGKLIARLVKIDGRSVTVYS